MSYVMSPSKTLYCIEFHAFFLLYEKIKMKTFKNIPPSWCVVSSANSILQDFMHDCCGKP
ncbi:unnamed protein product [Amoebophrya sp. A25]|nr:unnamed protein product [Amoebophrya sp. A25]|eukprot:GSA25T00014329001.1